MAEARVMMKLRHPNVVALLGVCTQQEPYLMVMELLPHVLKSYLEQHKALPRDRMRITLGVAEGMAVLAAEGMLFFNSFDLPYR